MEAIPTNDQTCYIIHQPLHRPNDFFTCPKVWIIIGDTLSYVIYSPKHKAILSLKSVSDSRLSRDPHRIQYPHPPLHLCLDMACVRPLDCPNYRCRALPPRYLSSLPLRARYQRYAAGVLAGNDSFYSSIAAASPLFGRA